MAQGKALHRRTHHRFTRGLLAVALGHLGTAAWVGVPLLAAPQAAQAQAARSYNIPAGTLEDALNRFGRESGILLSFSTDTTAGLKSPGLQGSHTPRSGLDALLAGSGLQAAAQPNGSYVLVKQVQATPIAATAATGATTLAEVRVTASAELPGDLPKPFAGGQIARGGRVGLLGNKDVMDTPFTSSNYTAELIANQQSRSIVDVLANDPSVVIGWPRDSYVDQFNIRGFNMIGEDVTYGGLFGIAPPGKVPVEIVERVELVKGMSAFMQGIAPSGSLGGMINLAPKRATDAPITRVSTTYDSSSHMGAHVDIGRRFGEDGEFGVRANGVLRGGETLRHDSSKDMGTAALGLDYRSRTVRLSADLGYDRLKVQRGEYWYFLDSNQFAIPGAPNTRQNNVQPWNRVNSKTTYAMARAEVDLTPGTTAYITGGANDVSLQAHLPEPIITNAAGDFTEYFQYRAVERQSRTGEIGIRSLLSVGGVDHALSLAASTLAQKSYGDRVFVGEVNSNIYNPVFVAEPDFLGSPAVAARFANLPLQSKSNFNSIALADDMSLLDGRVHIVAGVRRQSVDVSNHFRGTQTSAYDKSAWTFGGGLVVKPVTDVSLYGNYVEGLSQGPVAPATAANAGEIFAPYKSRQYEAGVKYDTGNLLLTAGVFQVARPNGQTAQGTLIYGLDGEQRNRGLELGFAGEPVRGVRLLGGAMLLDARLTRTQNGALDGMRASGSPRRNLRLGGEWDPAFAPGLTLTSRLSHASSQYVDSANQQSIPAWTTVDLGGRYTFALASGQKMTLRADIRNLANKRYWVSSIGAWLNAGSGRSLTLSAMVDF